MPNEVLIQTRIPDDTAQRVAALAGAEGLSVAAWLRRLVLKETNRMRIEAWVDKPSVTPREVMNYTGFYYLERVQDISASEVEFKLLAGPGPDAGRPLNPNGLANGSSWYNDPGAYRFFLKGSPKPWQIVRSMFDTLSNGVLLVLRSE